MSSHHFVKEGQEPALLILETMAFKHVGPLLEWVPLVIITDAILDDVLKWGIKIDVVIQRETAQGALEKKVEDQFPLQILSCKNDNVVSTGLQFLIQNKVTSVNVLSGSNEEILEKMLEFSPYIQIGMFGDKKWFLVRTGKLEKWMPAGHKLWLRPSNKALLHAQGILQKGDVWETAQSGMVKIHSSSPFWVGEPLDDDQAF